MRLTISGGEIRHLFILFTLSQKSVVTFEDLGSDIFSACPCLTFSSQIFSSTVEYNDAYALSLGWVFSVRENGNEMSTFVASEVEVKFSVQSGSQHSYVV